MNDASHKQHLAKLTDVSYNLHKSYTVVIFLKVQIFIAKVLLLHLCAF